MTFREFLEIKTAQAIVEHVETLSDAEAREFIDQLDESTIELIEAVLSEITAGTLKKIERNVALGTASQATLDAAHDVYANRARESATRSPYGGYLRSQQRRDNREEQQDDIQRRLQQGQPEWRWKPGKNDYAAKSRQESLKTRIRHRLNEK